MNDQPAAAKVRSTTIGDVIAEKLVAEPLEIGGVTSSVLESCANIPSPGA